MGSFHDDMDEYKKQLAKGTIQKAYRGLMDYMMGLRTHFALRYPDYFVSGSIYYGYMDMTYFSVIPESFKQRGLKIAVVFLHEACRFEVWLAGYNKQIQTKYWTFFKESGWDKYRLVPSPKGADSILEHVLINNPDFSDLDTLTTRIESETTSFMTDVEVYLAEYEN